MEDKTWLINGNALKKAFIDVMKKCKSTIAVRFWSIAIDAIQDKAFRADAVEMVHGRWEDGVCTACGFDIRDMIDGESEFRNWVWECVPYCPNCGAKMDGGNEDA